MKKILTSILCLVLLCSLAACGKPEDKVPDKAPGQKDSSDETKNQPSKKNITLNMTSWRTDDANSWNEINAEFHKDFPEIEVVFKGVTATEYDSVLQSKLQSRNAEDLMFLRAYGTGKQIYDAGYVLPLTKEKIPEIANIDAAYKAPWTDPADGTVYGVPGSLCMGGFFYNKGIFKKAGIEAPPETWAEFLEDCVKLEDAGYVAIADGLKDSWFLTEYISGTITPAAVGGSKWQDRLMKKEVDWSHPDFVKGMKWIIDLAKHLPEGYEGIGYDDAKMLFLSEKAAILPSGSFDLAYLQTTNPDIDLGWFFMPAENKGDLVSINFSCIMGYGINAQLKDDPEKLNAAYTYLNWLCGDKASAMFDNRVVGQYAVNTNVSDDIQNDLSAKILAGSVGCDLFYQIPYKGVSDASPDYTAVVTQALYDMLVNGKSAEDVCATMVEQQAWYFAP